MVLGFKNLTMVIIMQDSMSMECLKVMESIIGMTVASTKAISVMERDMGMESGKMKIRLTLVRIKWITKKDLEFIHGKIKRSTKVNLKMISKMDMVKFILLID